MPQTVKNLPANAGDKGSIPGSGKIPWRRKRQPTSVFLPGKSHGQRSLVGYSKWGHREVGHDLSTKQQQGTIYFLFNSYLIPNLSE